MNEVRYNAFARSLHWLVALIVLGMVPTGLYLGYGDPPHGPTTDMIYNLHESIGVTLWVLVLVRLVSRQLVGTPPLPLGTPRIIRAASKANHAALYLVLLIQPITGFLGNNANGYGLVWFNVAAVPTLLYKNAALGHQIVTMHRIGGVALVCLVTLHLLGAAYHGLVRRDGVVSRMA